MKIAPSILSADFSQLKGEVLSVEKAGADIIHIDVMDGSFVPNITFGPNIVKALRPNTVLPLDVHLMIDKPENFVETFAKAGSDFITVHQETTKHLHRLVQTIKSHGVKAGVAINPATPISMIEHVLQDLDLVLVMTVNPGFGGQSFITRMTEKIHRLKELREEFNYSYVIEVDGGINPDTAALCYKNGADYFVAGSYIFNGDNRTSKINQLKKVDTDEE